MLLLPSGMIGTPLKLGLHYQILSSDRTYSHKSEPNRCKYKQTQKHRGIVESGSGVPALMGLQVVQVNTIPGFTHVFSPVENMYGDWDRGCKMGGV